MSDSALHELQSTVAAAAGTCLAGPGVNDHGGQASLNNALGFPRIFIGIHQESSGINLNHTGQNGIAIAAGPITTHDKDSHIVESLTGFDPDAED